MDWEGKIPTGEYGAGKVSLHARDSTEVTSARPGHVRFNIYSSAGPQEYSLHRVTGKHWILANLTMTREKHNLPAYKPKYKEIHPDKAESHIEDPNYVFSAKIDGAHNLFYFPESGKQVRVVSYREGKKTPTSIIEHTHKVPSVFGEKVPEGLGGTILRGELYAINPKTGKATSAEQIAGLLNTNVWQSREKQQEHGELIPVLYDVVKFRGRDASTAPYAEKLRILDHVMQKMPDSFTLPRMATTPEAKKQLLEDIRDGKIPETQEGVVAWPLHATSHASSHVPTKIKFSAEITTKRGDKHKIDGLSRTRIKNIIILQD